MVTLNQQDLEKINQMILKTPFEFAYPLFQFFRNKVNEQNKTNEPTLDQSNRSGDKPAS